MRKLFLILIFLFITTISYAQTKSDIVGTWKDIVKVSGLKGNNAAPTYMVLNEDNTFIWGIDSTASDPLIRASTGVWVLTDEGEIKIIPNDSSAEIRYYKPSGENLYKYEYTEKNGEKVPVYMLEMDFYIEKIYTDSDK